MEKKCYRFFGGLLSVQEGWLNKMASEGYRLIKTEKLQYSFKACPPGQVEYRIEFIGHKSKSDAGDYHDFLEDMGYTVFYKNINLNYSIGKIRYRPWAEKGGRIAANKTTFNRELLIIEKEADGRPFELHTSLEDKREYYCNLRNPWLCLFLLFTAGVIASASLVFYVFALGALIQVILYQAEIFKIDREAKIKE